MIIKLGRYRLDKHVCDDFSKFPDKSCVACAACTRIDLLEKALLIVAPCNVGDCPKIGCYRWSDEDGVEYACEEHKRNHFYEHGPDPVPELLAVSSV